MNLKQDCNWRRRLPSRALLGSLALASASFAACGDDHGDDSAELQAILRDGDLTQIMNSMLTNAPAGAGAAGTSGTMTGGGAGGATGTAGPMAAGGGGTGVGPTGIAGTSGTAGVTGFAGTRGTAGSFGTAGTMGGPGPGSRSFPGQAMGFWKFDDCRMDRTELGDSTFSGGHTAYRSTTAFCRAGMLNSGVGFDEDDDLVLVPDQPNFVFSEGFTVAAWVKPVDLGGVRTIFRKRQDGTSTFVLAENGNKFQIVISLANGKAADLSVPAPLDTFTHVAATFDGIFLKLYINGAEAASKRVVGRLSDGVGPLLMGNDANKRRIDGVIDNVLFDTVAATPAEIAKLTCLPHPSVMSVTPTDPAAVAPGTPVNYDVQITNNSCDDAQFNFNAFSFSFNPDIQVNPSFGFAQVPAAGGTAHLPFAVTASADIEDFGTSQIGVNAQLFTPVPPFTSEFFNAVVNFSIIDTSTPCTIKPKRELEIRDVSVVDDFSRTGPGGAWTFGKLMEEMAPTPADAPAMVENMLSTFLTQQTVNSFPLPPRFGMQQVLDSMRGPDGKIDLNLSNNAFRLLAIVNRIDLNDGESTPVTTAGEGRFVFGFAPFGQVFSATLIIEYNIPASSPAEILDLANAWHALRQLPFPSETYNAALQQVTERFTKRNAAPGRVNGSALGQIRTNDFFTFGGAWEFREFHLDGTSGMLVPAPMAQTPDRGFNFSDKLGRFVLANEQVILTDKHAVPPSFENAPFQAGNVDASDFFAWQVPGVDTEARSHFARNTCNGCHTFNETGGSEFQVQPRFPGQESTLSQFLTGVNITDNGGVNRHFDELDRRGRILHGFVCPQEMLPPAPPEVISGASGTAGTGGGMVGSGGSGFPPPKDGGTSVGVAGSFGTDGGIATGAGGARGM